MKKVEVANINIEINSIDQYCLNKYRKYENSNLEKPELILRTRYFDDLTKKPQGEIIGQIYDATIIRISNNCYCRYLCRSKTRKIITAIYYNSSYSDVEIHLLKRSAQPCLSLSEYEYMYSGFAFSDRLTELGGAVLHGSAIAYSHQGIIFSANCGTGKSTHTRLWKELFHDKVTIVNDDKPAIRFHEGIPFMFGTPWSGKTNLHTNVQVPLKSIVFIKQEETNRIERLNTRDSIFSLMSQIARPYYDEKLGLKTMEIIEKLVQTVPIYRLHCNISQEAVDTVYQKLIQERVINA